MGFEVEGLGFRVGMLPGIQHGCGRVFGGRYVRVFVGFDTSLRRPRFEGTRSGFGVVTLNLVQSAHTECGTSKHTAHTTCNQASSRQIASVDSYGSLRSFWVFVLAVSSCRVFYRVTEGRGLRVV